MLKIGVFAGIAQVSIKCLRHYDDIGLLRPVEVDRQNGYRFYSVEQLPRLHRILALKELGFSLEEIARLIDAPLSNEQMREMLRNRQHDLERRVREEQERLKRVEAHLKMIDGTAPHYDVMLKNVPAQLVAGIPASFGAERSLLNPLIDLFAETRTFLKNENVRAAGPEFLLWHHQKQPDEVRVEALFPLSAPLSSSRRVKVYELPGATVATAVHRGTHATEWQANVAAVRWIDANGYRITGAGRAIYHHCDKEDKNDSVVEVQFPVVKAASHKTRK